MNCRVTTITSLCRWKPLRRFCSAVHNVDRACISVLSQVIRNVNEKKNRTDKYDFLREPWRWDSKNCEAFASQNFCSEARRNVWRTGISYLSVRFFFFINTYKDLREDAYICPSQPKKAPQNLLLHGKLNSGYRIHL